MSTKTQQGADKAIKHNGQTVFSRALVFCTHQQKWRQLFLSPILYSCYFLIIFSNFPFCLCLRLLQITLPLFAIACLFFWLEHLFRHRRRCQSCTRYASFVGRSLAEDGKQSCCSGPNIDVMSGVGYRRKFIIHPYYPFFPTFPLYTIFS